MINNETQCYTITRGRKKGLDISQKSLDLLKNQGIYNALHLEELGNTLSKEQSMISDSQEFELNLTNRIMEFDIFVKQTEKGRGVFASRYFRKGETVVVGHRVKILPERTNHSFQMDFDFHVELDEPGRLINHSCSPNTGVRT